MKKIYEFYLHVASNLGDFSFSYDGHSSKFTTGLQCTVLELDEKRPWFLFVCLFVVTFCLAPHMVCNYSSFVLLRKAEKFISELQEIIGRLVLPPVTG